MKLSHSELITILISISVMLIAGRLLGELLRKLRQPVVIGEILAGIVLGPTLLGYFAPEINHSLFPVESNTSIVLDGFTKISVILLVFIAGLEVDLNLLRNQKRRVTSVSFFSLIMPFAVGFATAYMWPQFFGISDHERFLFALFLGTALSITALPVIARILLDLNLFRSEIGALIISSAMLNDLVGWMVFSVVLAMYDNASHLSILAMAGKTFLFLIFMLTGGRWIFNRILPWVNKNFAWPGGILSVCIAFCLLSASITEQFGIHGIFGAFILGVAFSSSFHFDDRAKEIIHHFINNIFAPLFFVSIGLKINFSQNFDWMMTAVVILIAFFGKFSGVMLGASITRYNIWQSLAISSGMNARGAMEILIGTLAYEAGIINASLYVALIIMALVTSILSGPLMKSFLGINTRRNSKKEEAVSTIITDQA